MRKNLSAALFAAVAAWPGTLEAQEALGSAAFPGPATVAGLAALAQQAQQVNPPQAQPPAVYFYYADGQRMDLRASPDFGIVTLQPGVTLQQAGLTPGLSPIGGGDRRYRVRTSGAGAFAPQRAQAEPLVFVSFYPMLTTPDGTPLFPAGTVSARFADGADIPALAARHGLRVAGQSLVGFHILELARPPNSVERLYGAANALHEQGTRDGTVRWAAPNHLFQLRR